jgi:hypothetical protein
MGFWPFIHRTKTAAPPQARPPSDRDWQVKQGTQPAAHPQIQAPVQVPKLELEACARHVRDLSRCRGLNTPHNLIPVRRGTHLLNLNAGRQPALQIPHLIQNAGRSLRQPITSPIINIRIRQPSIQVLVMLAVQGVEIRLFLDPLISRSLVQQAVISRLRHNLVMVTGRELVNGLDMPAVLVG